MSPLVREGEVIAGKYSVGGVLGQGGIGIVVGGSRGRGGRPGLNDGSAGAAGDRGGAGAAGSEPAVGGRPPLTVAKQQGSCICSIRAKSERSDTIGIVIGITLVGTFRRRSRCMQGARRA